MNKELINDALSNALNLLNNEVECVIESELSDEYLRVIQKIEIALDELKRNE
jgi:hypothetical protein